jgi:hypothetical protein
MTLFGDPQITVDKFKRQYNVVINIEFIRCADLQITHIFEQLTGLKPSKDVSMAWIHPNEYFYEKGIISRLPFQIYANHNWNPVVVTWKSKSDKIYDIASDDIDCNDIVFGFEDLQPTLYYKQLYPGEKLPFKLKSLSFEFVFNRIAIDCQITMEVKDEFTKYDMIIDDINNFIAGYNDESEKKNRRYGLVHNLKSSLDGHNIVFSLDLGSAGPFFFRKLLPHLSDMNAFKSITID